MTDHKSFVFRFGEFEVKEQEFLLIRGGEAVPVEPKAFRVLLFLLRNPGRLVKKDEIMGAVWDDCAVSDNSLTRSIATLRRLLGDDAREPRYIATVQTVGYRLLCPVEVADSLAAQADASHPVLVSDPQSSHTDPVSGRRLNWLISGLAIAILLAAGGWIIQRFVRGSAVTSAKPAPDPTYSSRVRVVPLTNLSGSVWAPAFSPDAKQIAFIWDGENPGKGDLYVRLVGGESLLRLTHTRSGYVNSPTWSPDGTEIAFGRCDDNGGGVYIVPALGGLERKVTDVACPYGQAGIPQWTADGKSMVLQDTCTPDGAMSIILLSMETGSKRCLTNPPAGEGQGDYSPTLSPDQQTVAFLRFPTAGSSDIFIVSLGGGQPHRLTNENRYVPGIMWSPDSKSISFSSDRAGLTRIWRISLSSGLIEPDTVYPGIGALSRDGSKLAFVEPPDDWISSSVIWRADLGDAGKVASSVHRLLPADSQDYAPQISPDGREIVFESERTGRDEIWKCNTDGSGLLKLTSLGGHAGTPRWSPDGQWIAFDFRPALRSQIFVIDEQGRNLHAVTSESRDFEDVVPSWSRDQKAIYFASNRTGQYQIWRHELATGYETQVTHNGGLAAFESYDGKSLYFSKLGKAGLWTIALPGGEEHRILDIPHLGYWGHFAVTEDGVYVVDSDAEHDPAVFYYGFGNRRLTRVLTFNEGFSAVSGTANLGASRDGRTLLFTQGMAKSSLVLAEGFR